MNDRAGVQSVHGPASRALRWLAENELATGGIRAYSKCPAAYPEVTGYCIPTLLAYGASAFATRLARWLITVQRPDGSFVGLDGAPYVFDTAQALRGLLAIRRIMPDATAAAKKATAYLCSRALEGGSKGFGSRYRGRIPESIHLYAIPPLREAGMVLDASECSEVAERCAEYYCGLEDAFRTDCLTHYLGYTLEAAIDLDRSYLAKPVLMDLQAVQRDSGAVRGRADTRWICTPGVAQLAVCWYKVNQKDSASRAMEWLEAHQRRSGGFRGSHGIGARYFESTELSWAVKFFLDAHLLRREESGG